MPAEVPREVRLIEEPDTGRDIGDRLALEEATARCIDPPADHVAVGRDPERLGEASDEMTRPTPRAMAVALLVATVMPVVGTSSTVWAAGGTALHRFADDERARRLVGIGLAVVLVASVVLLWI